MPFLITVRIEWTQRSTSLIDGGTRPDTADQALELLRLHNLGIIGLDSSPSNRSRR